MCLSVRFFPICRWCSTLWCFMTLMSFFSPPLHRWCTVSYRGLPSHIVWDPLISRDTEKKKKEKNSSQLPSLCASVWEHFHTVFTLMRNWNRLGGGTWPSRGSEQSACVSKQTHKLHSSELWVAAHRLGHRIQLPHEFSDASVKRFRKYRLGHRSSVTQRNWGSSAPRQVQPCVHGCRLRPSAGSLWPACLLVHPTSHPWPSVRLCIPCVLPIGELQSPSSRWEHEKTCGRTFIPFDHVCCSTDMRTMWCNVGWSKWGRSIIEKASQVVGVVQNSKVKWTEVCPFNYFYAMFFSQRLTLALKINK